MAVQPPPPAYSPAPPAPTQRRRGGCGCGGCLLILLLILALVAAAIYFFAILPASAGAPAPATLTVYLDKVEVGQNNGGFGTAHTGQQLNPGNTVRTDNGGRASLLFPDGSITRLAGATTVTLTQETVDSHGLMHRTILDQDVGRTYSTVQALVSSGGKFTVQGHGLTADVRGTEFEVWIKPDHSAVIKLIKGKLQIDDNGKSVTLTAGQQVTIAANGTIGTPTPIAPDPTDPFTAWIGSENAATAGNQGGSLQTAQSSAPLGTAGATADTGAYAFAGGDLTATLSYPGSMMKLQVINQAGQVVGAAQGPPPVVVKIPSAPAGMYKGRVTGVILDHGPEPWSVSFASNAPCSASQPPAGTVPAGTPVRVTIDDTQLALAVSQSGLNNSSIHIQPTNGGAIVTGNIRSAGASLSGTVLIYAAPPGLGVTIASASVNGISVTAQLSAAAAQLNNQALSSLHSGFLVDRVYSCKGPQGGMMVIEGHGES